jgi:hypothetical protein
LLRTRLELLRLRLVLRLIMLRLIVLRLMLLRLVGLRLIIMLLIMLRLIMLLVMLWLIVLRLIGMLRLIVLLLARIERLRLARREWLAGHGRLVVIIVVAVIGKIIARGAAGLLLGKGLTLTKLFLSGGDQAEIMLGVLIIILGGNRISGALCIAGKLEIFFGDVRRRSTNFYVLPIGLVHPGQRILVMVMMATATTTLAAIATTHAFIVLTVSHGLLFREPRYLRRH